MVKEKQKVVINNPYVKLSREYKRKMERAIAKAKKESKFPTTAQNTIPYRVMYKNGMAQLEGFLFSKSICFEDINYELRDNEDKKSVFKKLSDVYNFFTEDMHVQMTYMNTRVPQDEINEMLKIKSQGDQCDELREEMTEILLDKEKKNVIL